MADETKPAAPKRERNRFTVMEAVVRDFMSLSPNDRDWVRNEIKNKEDAENTGQAQQVTPVPQPESAQG
jgi:hypothetical protein